MTFVLLEAEHADQAEQRAVVGKDADDVGAPADLLVEALERVGAPELGPVRRREGVKGEDVLLRLAEHRRHLRQPLFERGDRLAQPLASLVARLGLEDRPDQRTEQPVLVAAGVAEAIPEEVDGAALPGTAKMAGDRGLKALVGVGDDELHAAQAARDQRLEELAPERLGLRLADVDAEDLPPTRLVHAVGNHHALVDHPAAVAHLLGLAVEPQVGVVTLERALAEGLNLLVEQGADPGHLRARDPEPERLHQLVDAPGRDPAYIRLLHDRQQRLLAALARLEQAVREVAAPAQLRDLELDHPRARVPLAPAVAVAVRRAVRRALPVGGADQLRHFQLHQLLDDQPHRLAQHIRVLVRQHLPGDLLDRHALALGHRGALPSSISWNRPTIMGAAVAGTIPRPPKSRRPKPRVAAAEALRTAYTASSRSRSALIPSDRVLHHATGRDHTASLSTRSTIRAGACASTSRIRR
jgi:hypothetical protein